MRLASRLERRRLGLPPARARVLASDVWMPLPDGERLATRVLRPADPRLRRGTVLVRSERALEDDGPLARLCRWLAEDGRSVVLQSCRGRGASQGRFRPFADEQADGDAALCWLRDPARARELGLDGELVLLGLGYSAFTAWAALAALPGAAAAIATGFGARAPHAWLYRGGALQLEAALALAARLDGRHGHEPDALDFARAGFHRPLVECDRVAVRELEAFQDWIAHPARDAWWSERTPPLPERPPPALFVGGWYDCALPAALADRAALADLAAPGAAPELVLGPWGAAALPRRERPRACDMLAAVATAVLRFVAHAVGDGAARGAPVRVFVRGAGWREVASWPPEAAVTRVLYLRSGGRANTLDGDGALADEPPGEEPADTFVSDPADPVPSQGGAAWGRVAGPADRRDVERRGDVLCFNGPPLASPLELAGRVHLTLYTDDTPTDTSATLVAVEPAGVARWLCEGIARGGTRSPGAGLEVDLGWVAARLAAGTRLRLELAGASLPRFARPDDARDARLRVVHHDAERPSSLRFDVLV